MSKDKSKIDSDQLKVFNSPIYRRKIKRIVESVKRLRGIPHGTKLPGRPKQLKPDATEKERDQAAKVNNFRFTRENAHYWARGTEVSYERRAPAPAPSEETEE